MKVKFDVVYTGEKCNQEARKAAKAYEALGFPVTSITADGKFYVGGSEEDGGAPVPLVDRDIEKIGDQILHISSKLKVFCGDESTVTVTITVEGEEVE